MKVYSREERMNQTPKRAPLVKTEADYVFEKTMECPICQKEFTTKMVKTGKAHFSGTEEDLRPLFVGVDTIKYDVYMCPHCGYASIAREYSNVTAKQRQIIMREVGERYRQMNRHAHDMKGDIYTYDMAIYRYNMALLTAMNKPAKLSEQAYLCLKLSWLYRAEAEHLENPNGIEVTELDLKLSKNYRENEKKYVIRAFDGLKEAIATEFPPICGMDEHTLNYLMSVLAFRCEKLQESYEYAYKVLQAKNVPPKLKMKQELFIEKIKAAKKNENRESEES